MPIIEAVDFHPKSFYRNGHLGTLIPHFFSHQKLKDFKRVRLNTPDGDFLDVDKIINNNKTLAILCHGLEGSSDSNYIHNMASLLSQNRFDIVAMNYRGCSGTPNLKLRMYHSGATDDIHLVISQFENDYNAIVLVGYSLGANMVIKYNGEKIFTKSQKLKASVGISAPCDLAASSVVISKKENYIYEKRFLISLTKKVKLKAQQYPNQINLNLLKQTNTLKDFDNYFTGPIHGFKDAEEYYYLNSSNRFLSNISYPTLIINAINDPFLDYNTFPYKQAQQSEYVHLLTPPNGGHVGFMSWGMKYSWADIKALKFLINNLSE